MSAYKTPSTVAKECFTCCKYYLVVTLNHTDPETAAERRYTGSSQTRTSTPIPAPLPDRSDSLGVPPGSQQHFLYLEARFSLAVSGLHHPPHTHKQVRQASATKKPRLMWT